jgi:VIT family
MQTCTYSQPGPLPRERRLLWPVRSPVMRWPIRLNLPSFLELMRQKLQHLPEPPPGPGLTKRYWTGALGLCLLSFLSTFPVVIPFLFLSDARLALRVSYAVAIVMLFCCGYVFGIHSGLRPWAAGLSMVAVGGALVGIAVALGG